jgi:hypothetical protein
MNVGIGAQDVGQHDGIGVIGLRSRHGVTPLDSVTPPAD